ncbi:F-box protein SKIP24-like isoform X1 [Trifolium pratense]|uniref:F-box protein SKIP24-like isoform X1 n=1 Tax=Trifolium pratense TaxID=57577 RepID=UPI001E6902D3|nr:F-box protein SKIP24-like isoform X1 [Trifolium pratense]
MSSLPRELWTKILEIGIQNNGLTYKDLCCISISCRLLHRLSSEDSLWNHLLSIDFPLSPPSSSYLAYRTSKTVYSLKFVRDKERKNAAHRRVVLRKESQIGEHYRKLLVFQTQLSREKSKAIETSTELSHLRRVREASVALNVWQPEVVRGRQKQMVEQCVVPAESRIRALEMELRLCKQQILGLEKSHRDEQRRLDTAEEELESMKYHPLRKNEHNIRKNEHKVKRKKLKSCHSSKSVELDDR